MKSLVTPQRLKRLATVFVLLVATAQIDGQVVESQKIRLFLLGRDVGVETYELRRTADSVSLIDEFAFVDRGGRIALSSELILDNDLKPRRLRAQGRTYRFLNVDVDIEFDAGVARVRNLGTEEEVDVPEAVFAVPGYAPLAARALLIGYWERHGRPLSLTTVPGAPTASVAIEHRGEDSIVVDGATIALSRYSVRGVAWGREVVWLDEYGDLAAIFTRANILPFAGIRDELVAARAQLESLAVGEFMADLARLSEGIEPLATGSFALVGARLVEGTLSPPLDDAFVLVSNGRILATGSGTPVVPAGFEVIDATGKTIVPGLWDMHAHAAQIEWAPAYLAAGVTTVRDMGGVFGFLTAFRDSIEAGRGLGPRLLLAGLVDGDRDNAFGAVVAATPAEGRAVVDRYHAAGFQQMKLYSLLEPDVVAAITDRAHELGMTVTGHIPRALSLPEALAAGMDQVAHMPLRGDPGSPEMERLLELMVDSGTVADPVQSWGELLGRSHETPIASFQPGIVGAPWPIAAAYNSVHNEATAEAVEQRRRGALSRVLAIHRAGIPIVAGTDYGVPAHSLHRELELYVQAGLTPLEAIRTATAIPAEAMGLAGESGTIEPGKRADLLILDADPLADISAIRAGRWVVVDGVMYDCAELWRAADFDPDAGSRATRDAVQ